MAAPVILDIAELPEMARAQIFHRSRYGCVRCGVTICRFVELPVDDEPGWLRPSTILLCPGCITLLQQKPLERAQYNALLKRPIASDPLFDRSRLPYHPALPGIRVGGTELIRDTSIPLMVGGYAPIRFVPPTSGIGAIRITLNLSSREGSVAPVIQDNLWLPWDNGWTFEHCNGRYVVRSADSEAYAELEISASDCITVVRLVSFVAGRRIEMTPDRIGIDGKEVRNGIASGQLVGLYA